MASIFKQAAVAAMAIMALASARAETFDRTSYLKLNSDFVNFLSDLPTLQFEAQGASSYSPSTATLTWAPTSTTTSNAEATDLVSLVDGAGLNITWDGNVFSLQDFSFNNVTRSVDAVISFNGVTRFIGTVLHSDVASTVYEPFVGGPGHGDLSSGPLKLTSGAAQVLATSIGYSFLAPTLQAREVGHLTLSYLPEPSTYALMGLGLMGVAVAARRSRPNR